MSWLRPWSRRRWVPRLSWGGACLTDGRDEDAEGWSITFEWLGVAVEFWLTIRGRE